MIARKNPKHSFLSVACKMLGKNATARIIHFIVKQKYCRNRVSIPHDLHSARTILYILPQKCIDLLYQIENISALCNHFSSARSLFVCQQELIGLGHYLPRADRIFSYDMNFRYAFSPALNELRQALLKEYIDVSFFLENKPHISMKLLNCQVAASIRIGYHNPENDSYFNVQIRSGDTTMSKQRQNLTMATLLGAQVPSPAHWLPSAQESEHIIQIFKQSSIDTAAVKGGIDFSALLQRASFKWLEQLVIELRLQKQIQWYGFCEKESRDVVDWCSKKELPLIHSLDWPHTVALLAESDFFITGTSPCFKIAELVRTPAAGLFLEQEQTLFCESTDACAKPLLYSQKPDESTISMLVAMTKDTLSGRL